MQGTLTAVTKVHFRLVSWLILALSLVSGFLLVGSLVQKDELRQRTLLQLVGALTAYYRAHGDYPRSLDAANTLAVLKESGLPPDEFDYTSAGGSFSLRIRGSERRFHGLSGEVDIVERP